MFHVERWLGVEGGSQKKVSPLSLDRLNAKARERAAALKRETVSSSPALAVPDRVVGKDVSETPGNDVLTDFIVEEQKGLGEVEPEEKQTRKRKKHQGQNADSSPGLQAPGSAEKVQKVKKVKTSHVLEEQTAFLGTPESSRKEGKRKKVKKSVSDEADGSPGDKVDPITEAGIDKKVPVLVEVSGLKVEKKRKKEKFKKREGSTLGTGDESVHLRGILGEVDGIAAVGTLDERTEDESKPLAIEDEEEEHTLVDSSGELRTVEVSTSELDLSTIERNVERILGRDNLGPAEPQDKGPVLPWMRDPLDIDTFAAAPLAQVPGLDIRLREVLTKTGIKNLFPVQMAVWYETVGPGFCERDVCVSSPTGSGKTLSYALPIVQKLSSRVLRLLRALVVLPTRDLAAQVKAVFDTIAPAVGLSVGLAVGQTSITAEATELVKFRKTMVHSFGKDEGPEFTLGESCVDILVATPGRLMDHLRNTKGFTLEHLQFLVVDETDRLLRQAYQDWLPNVLAATTPDSAVGGPKLSGVEFWSSFPGLVRTVRRCCPERGDRGIVLPRLTKMVLSATLTRDPAKIAQLDLYRPIYVATSTVGNRYQLPKQLKSFRLVCKAGEKPLYLVALLQQLYSQPTIVFTASIVATHRLYILLSCFKGLTVKVVEYSSLQHQQARSKSLAKFRNGQAHVLIASDAMTRGMDVEGVVNVVNYDMPVYAKTYVHRVGRTARAGQGGTAYTLLRREEVRHFKIMLKKVDNSKCKDFSLPSSDTEGLYQSYIEALEKLKEIAADEAASTPHGNRMKNDREQEVTGPDELFI